MEPYQCTGLVPSLKWDIKFVIFHTNMCYISEMVQDRAVFTVGVK